MTVAAGLSLRPSSAVRGVAETSPLDKLRRRMADLLARCPSRSQDANGSNFPRRVSVRTKYDRDNLFRNYQSIPPRRS